MADRSRHPGGVNGSRCGVGRLEGCTNRVSLASNCHAGVGGRPRRSFKRITQIHLHPEQSDRPADLEPDIPGGRPPDEVRVCSRPGGSGPHPHSRRSRRRAEPDRTSRASWSARRRACPRAQIARRVVGVPTAPTEDLRQRGWFKRSFGGRSRSMPERGTSLSLP